jgi:hypothetical protein
LVKSKEKKKAQLGDDWSVTLLNWPTQQTKFILVPFLREKPLICGYITKSLVKTSELWLLKVFPGRLEAKVGHLEGKKCHLFTFLNLLIKCATYSKLKYSTWPHPFILIAVSRHPRSLEEKVGHLEQEVGHIFIFLILEPFLKEKSSLCGYS